jgi:glyoxylase-like metal-dependent hydrolase (beta-lactamase superfamily II)
VDSLPPETAVYPGHMGTTTLGAERATNPFLAELAR